MTLMSSQEIKVDDYLTLRQLQPDEAEELFNLTKKNYEYLAPWMPWLSDMKTAQDSKKFIQEVIEKWDKDPFYGYGAFYDGKLAGHMSLMQLPEEEYPEIGYWLDYELNGKGLTTQAVQVLTDFGLKTLKLKKILIKAKPENAASNRIAEKCGYKLEETKEYPGRGIMNVWAITLGK